MSLKAPVLVLGLAEPGDNGGLLQRLAVREGQVPRHLVLSAAECVWR